MSITLDINQIRGWISEAGEIARRHFQRIDAEWKGVADPVTEADRAIERLLTGYLHAAYPDHGIIGEEYGADALDRDYLWTVDPIDGTRAYVEGLPTWSVTIALLHERVPIFGLVYIPLYDDWTYTDGNDVINNGHSVRDCLKRRWEEDSYLLARSDTLAYFDIRFTRIMGLGSTAAHMTYTARGTSVANVTYDSYVWDLAAGAAILARQGGSILTQSGAALDFRTLGDLRERIPGLTLAGHPDVTHRLLPLITPRETPLLHPEW